MAKIEKFQQQAFPAVTNEGYKEGMSLRDWFAGMAMQGCCDVVYERTDNKVSFPLIVSKWAYDVADAMMAERKKSQGKEAGAQ